LRHKISIDGPRRWGPQGTLTDFLCIVIDSNLGTQSILPPYAPLMPQGTHLSIRVGRDIFIGTARFSDTSAALWPIVNDFLKNLQGSNLSDLGCSVG